MSETVEALRRFLTVPDEELLTLPDEERRDSKFYVMGTIAAELVSSATGPDLDQAIVMIKDLQRSDREHDVSPFRRLLLSMLCGFLQSFLADRHPAMSPSSPLTVPEHVLNLLTVSPQDTTELANAIGCSPEVTEQAITQLQEAGLIELSSETAGDQLESYEPASAAYELTTKGEQRLDDRFFGQLADESLSPDYDLGNVLGPLTGVVAELNAHAPGIAAVLYPGLAVLKDRVDDPELRAAADGELGDRYTSG
jgi:hypothetical protein